MTECKLHGEPKKKEDCDVCMGRGAWYGLVEHPEMEAEDCRRLSQKGSNPIDYEERLERVPGGAEALHMMRHTKQRWETAQKELRRATVLFIRAERKLAIKEDAVASAWKAEQEEELHVQCLDDAR